MSLLCPRALLGSRTTKEMTVSFWGCQTTEGAGGLPEGEQGVLRGVRWCGKGGEARTKTLQALGPRGRQHTGPSTGLSNPTSRARVSIESAPVQRAIPDLHWCAQGVQSHTLPLVQGWGSGSFSLVLCYRSFHPQSCFRASLDALAPTIVFTFQPAGRHPPPRAHKPCVCAH